MFGGTSIWPEQIFSQCLKLSQLNTGVNKNNPSKTFGHFITVIELGSEITNLVVKNSNNIFTYKFSSDIDFLLPSSKAITEKHYC